MISVSLYHRAQVFQIFLICLKPSVFVHNKYTVFIAGVKNLLVMPIMSAAICVRSHFLQKFNSVIIYSFGNGISQTTMIGVAGGSFDFNMLIIQKETFFSVKFKCSETKVHTAFINNYAVFTNFANRLIKIRTVRIPQLRFFCIKLHFYGFFTVAFYRSKFISVYDKLTAVIVNFSCYHTFIICISAVFKRYFRINFPSVLRNFLRIYKNSVITDMKRIRNIQLYAAVYPHSLIAPKLVRKTVYPNGKYIIF